MATVDVEFDLVKFLIYNRDFTRTGVHNDFVVLECINGDRVKAWITKRLKRYRYVKLGR